MKKITIIGANSYIARNLLKCLKQNDDTYDIKLYDYGDIQVDGENNYCQVNVLDRAAVANIQLNCDVIYYFVGKTGTANGFNEYNQFIDINERALLNILDEYLVQKSTAKIVFPSTRLVYKGAKGLLREDSEKEFKTIYAINKYACETYLEQYANVFGVKFCIFRICIPYGTMIKNASSYGTAEFMLSKARNGQNITLYGDGSVRRTLTHMADLCNILIRGGMDKECINDVYNIGGEDYSLKEMAELISSQYNTGIEYLPWPEISAKIESGDTVFDDTKLKMKIGSTDFHRFKDWITQQ